MIEQNLDIWSVYGQPNVLIGITTNGTVRNDGTLVMGRGTALQAKKKFPDIGNILGKAVKNSGNKLLVIKSLGLFTFPVKHNWYETINIKLIQGSATDLYYVATAAEYVGAKFYLPRPGCGVGGLRWEDVKPLLEFLPDNVICVKR